jgi:hypothetical protein
MRPAKLEVPSLQSGAPERLNLPGYRDLSSLGQTFPVYQPPGWWQTLVLPPPPSYLKENVWGQCYLTAPTPQQVWIQRVLFPETPAAVTRMTGTASPPASYLYIVSPPLPLWLLPPISPSQPRNFKEWLQQGIERDPIRRNLDGLLAKLPAFTQPLVKNLLKDNLADAAFEGLEAGVEGAVDALVQRVTQDQATKTALEKFFSAAQKMFLEGRGVPHPSPSSFIREPPPALAPPPLPLQGDQWKLNVGILIKGLTIRVDTFPDFTPKKVVVAPTFSP